MLDTVPPLPQLFTLRQTARQLWVSERHLRRLIAQGTIKAVRLGPHSVRVSSMEIERICQEGAWGRQPEMT